MRLGNGWRIRGVGNLASDRLYDHTSYQLQLDPQQIDIFRYDDVRLPGSPAYSWRGVVEGELAGFGVWAAARGVGHVYLDGENLAERSIAPYTVLDAGVGRRLGGGPGDGDLTLSCLVGNLLNREHEIGGYIGSYREEGDRDPRWFVGVPRHVRVGLRWGWPGISK